ncbi:uncharacterized protein SPAPADRAFT_139632 [Spathaspora passalidarum NRRL Y-27907]|uniref:Kynurenine formamidase n=1 Tax=Spathaspora passalidarum (strain NRRL Y-27907 / 11-Y1) TaxID=619300 RepID=G3AP60_SPAPN|nr:uncharacterized protein SPAPADRAFT_139632 [Spathaspora passalidarum NRRL Y-27907]EGW32631.1 hypothetical protein SPAPADRAFT_139632 [Spathaspora passalidarum NRRL Y-27907]
MSNSATNLIISYGEHRLQKVKVFNYDKKNEKTVIYLHGGGWRDPNNTFDDFQELVQAQLNLGIGQSCNFFSINYRLSPEVKHPMHLIDVLSALKKIEEVYKVERTSIVGHSIGATLMLQLLNSKEIIQRGLSYLQESNQEEVKSVGIKFDHLVFLDGIYDVVSLLKEYPSYSVFVNEAFVSKLAIADATQISIAKNLPFEFVHDKTQFIVIQSLQDELLSCRQTQLFVDYLTARGQPVTVRFENFGEHEQVYRKGLTEELNNLLSLA